MKFSIIIPVYGSEKILRDSYGEISKAIKGVTESYEILFRVDGSPDNSLDVLKSLAKKDERVKVYVNKTNRGLGYTLRKLFEDAKGEHLIYFDADAFLCFDLSFLPTIINRVEEADAVIVSRYFYNPLLPFHRWLASEVYHVLNRVLFSIDIRDIGSGFVVFRKNALQSLRLKSDGFDIHAEVFVKMAKKGYKILEVPLAYKHWSGGSFRLLRHGPKALVNTLKLWRDINRG